MVRTVTRAVVARMGSAGPEVVEAVVTEVLATLAPETAPKPMTTPRGATVLPVVGSNAPSFDVCATCIEQERSRGRSRAVMTTTGRNSKGIVARTTSRVAELGGDILDISQTLVGDFFTMIIVIDTTSLTVPFARFQEELQAAARELGCQAMVMHENVMASLHRV